jgi:hypothetical protein
MTKPQTDRWNCLGICVMTVIIIMAAASLFLHPVKQRDFLGIYTALSAFNQGHDPYGTVGLPPVEGQEIASYVYPPYTLYLFQPATWLTFATAARIFLTLKLIAIGGLVYLWHRLFNLNRYYGLFWILVPLAFSGALIADIRAGNISTFEELIIWIGFYLYTQKKTAAFATAIVLAAIFKLTPILLLGLLAAKWRKKELFRGAFFGAVFIGVIAASAIIWPELFASFLRNARGLGTEHGENNPSTWALIGDVVLWLKIKTGHALPAIVPPAVYAAVALGVAAVSAKMFSRLRLLEEKKADLWRICLMCLLFALVIPRFKNYSYILLIGPSLYVLASCKWVNPVVPLGALLAIFCYQSLQYLGTALQPFYTVQREYYCLLLAWMAWGLCCYNIWRETSESDCPRSTA